MDSRTVGILGGGQLGRMMVEAANRLNVKTIVLDAENAPAKQINASNDHVNGAFNDAASIIELSRKCDVLTVEIEHVDAEVLQRLENEGKEIHPSPKTIKLIQDKYIQKEHLIAHGIATATSVSVESTPEALAEVGTKFGYPFMLKSRTNAYDGRGNFVVKDKGSIAEALETLHDRPLYVEKWAPFVKELAAMVIRTTEGDVYAYPTVETIHQNNVCHLVYAPARVSDSVQFQARILAENTVKTLTGAGIFGVEMFLLESGEILINEIAPRPHNSGHYTQDGCITSQFEAHIRAILGLPLPKGFNSMTTPNTNAIMLNVLGGSEANSELKICEKALATAGASVHLYGKSTRSGRKMGHINIVAASMGECETKLAKILGDADSSSSNTQELAGCSTRPLVGVIMGSDSDLPVMAVGANILKKFGVPFEVTIVSAHRTPFRMDKYAKEAASRGIKAIIAGAGGAAHLPGMVAAMTSLPVIGVPVVGGSLGGVDSLHSIVQMPRGIPVATVAINNATNAALLAIRILSTFSPEYQLKMEHYLANMEEEVLTKAEKIETIGYEAYLEGMEKKK